MGVGSSLPSDPVVAAWDARRRRVWRRAWAGVGLAGALLLGVRVWWGAVAHERLTRAVEAYRAAGEPVYLEDFLPPRAVPDDENAATAYQKAAGMIAVPDAMQVVGTYYFDDFRWARAYPGDARLVVEANTGMLAELRRASAMTECDWGVRIASPAVNTLLPTLSWTRHLSRSVIRIGVSQHVIGDDEGMMQTLADLHTVHRRFTEGRATFALNLMVSGVCEAVCCSAIEFVVHDLQIESSQERGEEDQRRDGSSVAGRSATRDQIRAEIARLLDEDWMITAWRRAMNTERAVLYDFAASFGTPGFAAGMGIAAPLSGRPLRWVIGPSFDLDAVKAMKRVMRVRDAGCLATYGEAMAIIGFDPNSAAETVDEVNSQVERASRLLSETMMWRVEGTLIGEYRVRADRRMAAAALAIRMYEVDHGRRPASLEALVPEYLPAVPEDPFCEPGQPIRYAPDAVPPLLYSVGPNGADDGGQDKRLDDGRRDDAASDILFYLNGDRPRPPLDLSQGLKARAASAEP
ncbi:MAG: hypothetical protein FLDDKLPJ_01121 [Phycisphaerae bacterium]|nr:hypothetical protein [Phycisphaerae bacterium]